MAKTRGRARRGSRGYEQPQGAIRQSQVVTTFGPGAMVDLIHDAVLIGGLDLWSLGDGQQSQVITEPRLRARVVHTLLQRQAEDQEAPKLSLDRPFRTPPAGDDSTPTRSSGIKAFEFPRWFVCQSCRALVRKDQLELKGHSYRHACVGKKGGGTAVPVRFVSACSNGHLSDFPWIPFAHGDSDRCAHPQLYLFEGASGDFSDVIVRCETCGAPPRKLSEAKVDEALPHCHGDRPWLGFDASEDCDQRQKLMVRTASNSFFPQVMSALTVPDPSDPLRPIIEPNIEFLKPAVESPEMLPMIRKLYAAKLSELGDASDEEVLLSIKRVLGESPTASAALRTPEFDRFMSEPLEQHGELAPEKCDFFARRAEVDGLPRQIERVVLATKLREVRAMIGFTRLEAATPNLQGEFDIGARPAKIARNASWLPATEIRGEGVFLAIDEDELQAWEQRDAVKARDEKLRAAYKRWTNTVQKAPPYPGIRFYMAHTLSHLLITAVSLDCGYAASAIRERIYCSAPGEEKKMAAILLSTGTSGSEGTLGGLVEQGRRLPEHLRYAWELASLCSNDPVCAHHDPDGDFNEQYLNGAACHGCLFIAECSCERFNKYLDRALVVPVIGQDKDLAFFPERP